MRNNDLDFIKSKFDEAKQNPPSVLDKCIIEQKILSECRIKEDISNDEKTTARSKRIKLTKILLVAAILIISVCIAFPVSAKYVRNGASDKIVQYFMDHFEIDLRNGNSSAIHYPDETFELIRDLKAAGFESVIIPSALSNSRYSKDDVHITEDELFLTVEIDFEFDNNIYGYITLSKHKTDITTDLIGKGEIGTQFDSSKQITVNGMDVVIFSNEKRVFICYVDNNIEYDMSLENCSLDKGIEIVKTLEYSKSENNSAIHYPDEAFELMRELKAAGFENVIIPSALLDNRYSKDDVYITEDELFLLAEIDVELDNNINGYIGIIKYKTDYTEDMFGTGKLNDSYVSSEQITVNGIDVLVFSSEDQIYIRYLNHDTEYSISLLNCDMDFGVKIAKTLE